MILLISDGHIGAPKRYTNMASHAYKALQTCVKRFGQITQKVWATKTWKNCLCITLLYHFVLLASSTGRFPIYFFVA